MSVYLPPLFSARDSGDVSQLVLRHPFATLITPTTGEPHITHLPLLVHARLAPHGTVVGHVARANPHWRHLTAHPSIAIFHGPHAYVSPSWYGEPAAMVPTWNYAIVHMHGIAELVDDAAGKQSIVEELTGHFEAQREPPWHLQLEGDRLGAMLAAIVGFRIAVTRIDAKFKMSQNRSAADRERVVTALGSESDPDAIATALWMSRREGRG
ncbi:MAG: FMN-binding negative transcriptional regulator [Betaproteobacteria bacterium]